MAEERVGRVTFLYYLYRVWSLDNVNILLIKQVKYVFKIAQK